MAALALTLALLALVQDPAPTASAPPLAGVERPAEELLAEADQLHAAGRDSAARPLLEQALAALEREYGPLALETGGTLARLAQVEIALGELQAAEAHARRALAAAEAAAGPDHLYTAVSLSILASALADLGRPVEARDLYERALKIKLEQLGEEAPEVAIIRNDLASVLYGLGLLQEAGEHYRRALAVHERACGPEHPNTLVIQANLAALFHKMGRFEEALPLYRRGLEIRERVSGPDHPHTAKALNNLAVLLSDLGRNDEALTLHQRALEIRRKSLGAVHPEVGASYLGLGTVAARLGRLEEARGHDQRALEIFTLALGEGHPNATAARVELALVDLDAGRHREARAQLLAASELRATRVGRELASLSEEERFRSLASYARLLGALLGTPAAEERANVELLWAWKGAAGRAMTRAQERLRASLAPEQLALLAELRAVQAELSGHAYTVAEDVAAYEAKLARLRDRRNDLERQLLKTIDAGQKEGGASPTLEQVRAALPAGGALVELAVHPVYEAARFEDGRLVREGDWSEARLTAWIVRADAPEVLRVELGSSAAVAAAVEAYKESLAGRRGGRALGHSEKPGDEAAQELRAALWNPLAAALGGVTTLIVCPDGFLGALPFAAILEEDGRYLIERCSVSYLSSAADLLPGPTAAVAPRPGLLLAGGIDYDAAPEAAGSAAETRGSWSQYWDPLPATKGEVEAIAHRHERFAGSGEPRLLLSGAAATEARLKECLPEFGTIHLATHGWFHPEGLPSLWEAALAAAAQGGSDFDPAAAAQLGGLHPGLLSGLVCAEANAAPAAGGEDGRLTAEEVAWLDLSGAGLVVLSACETGLGRPQAGEGLISLRRAFHQAGARTVVSSLWKVEDEATQELMLAFHLNRWRDGLSTRDALRNAQLAILNKNRARYGSARPVSWAAFVLSGDWR